MKHLKTWSIPLAVVVALALSAGLLASCSGKSSPTAPATGGQGGTTPPPTGSGTWNITVTVDPTSLQLPATGSTDPVPTALVTIDVRSSSGATPPNGSTVVVSATNGTLSGSNFTGQTSVALVLTNGRASAVFTPTTSGTALITARLESSVGQATISIGAPGEAPVFHIDRIVPNVGDPAGGNHVTIYGQNIVGPVKVTFGGNSAQVLNVAADHIVVAAPPAPGPVAVGSTLPVTVTVTNAFGSTTESSDSLTNGYIYSNGSTTVQPQVFSVTPTTGPQTGNTAITIQGSGFQSPVQVLFLIPTPSGSIQLEAPLQSVTGNRIVALTPDITQYTAAGTLISPVTASIRVVNLDSGFNTTASQQFFYGQTIRITSVGPTSGPYTGGTQVTIYGSGFDEPVAVCIVVGSTCIGQQVISVAGDQIVIRTGPLAGNDIPACGQSTSGAIRVTNIQGGASASAEGGSFSFVGPQNPVILGISPTSGAANTTTFTISGSNLPGSTSNTRVLFGGADGSTAPLSGASTSSVTGTVPTPPPGFSFNSQACTTSAGTGTQLLPTPISVTVRNLITGCEGTLTNGFTLVPDNTCVVTTPNPTPTPSGPPVANFTSAQVSGHTMQFTDTSTGNPTSWLWDFGDASSSTQQNPTHTYAAAGNYSVKLTVSNSSGSNQTAKVVAVP